MTRLGGHRGKIHDAIDSLEPTYSTNLGAGVETGYATAVEGLREGATNRVVLISDALANTATPTPTRSSTASPTPAASTASPSSASASAATTATP